MTKIEWIAHMHGVMFRNLWYFLRGVTEEELDWKLHPDANTMRRILTHLLFTEEWTAHAIAGTLTSSNNLDPKTYAPMPFAELRSHYDAAFTRTQEGMGGLTEGDLERKVDMLGVMTADLLGVLQNHVTHTAGHMYQIRLIRGTFSRAHHTDKTAFDPW